MPLPLTVSCSSKIQTGFTFLIPAYPGCPGKEADKWLLLFAWNSGRLDFAHPAHPIATPLTAVRGHVLCVLWSHHRRVTVCVCVCVCVSTRLLSVFKLSLCILQQVLRCARYLFTKKTVNSKWMQTSSTLKLARPQLDGSFLPNKSATTNNHPSTATVTQEPYDDQKA